ncbi:MAG: ABC transporter ATP-binding protein [Burkholderiales bacterium]|nr:ABC transporter ATP-binding protein [Burkholderiales bacterium]
MARGPAHREDAAPVLRLRGITKRFGALTANDDISLDLGRGEVLGLLGENGAGKSTLVSILFGHYVADGGDIEVFGRPLPPGQPKVALAAGIGMVHQHFTLADNLSVLDNVLLGTEPLLQPFSRRGGARARLLETATRFGLAVDPQARVADLSVGERQRVEILKALYRGARILILDEPTAVLTPQEAQSLFATLRTLTDDGLSIIFISHKLNEILAACRRVAVLRQGRLIAVRDAAGTDRAELAALMIGRRVASPERKPASVERGVLLSVRDLAAGTKLRRASFDVRGGEIVGIAGVSGNGQAQLADALFGLLPANRGEIRVNGERVAATPRAFIRAGVARVPEDRGALGVVGDLPVWQNAIAERYRDAAFSRFGWLRRAAARVAAQQIIERFDVRGPGIDARTRSLSGGNIQKLVLGRVLITAPEVVVAHQPTWGLDLGAVSYVHTQLLAARDRGAAILLISEDLDELFALSDRIAVMFRGELSAARSGWTIADIGLAMAGGAEPVHG